MNENESNFWWDEEDEDVMAEKIFGYVRNLQSQQQTRIDNLKVFKNIYDNKPFYLGSYGSSDMDSDDIIGAKLNVTKNMCDAATARIGKAVPSIKVVPIDADWSFKRRARRLNSYLNGRMYSSDVQVKAPLVFKDAVRFGTGLMKVEEKFGEIIIKRIHQWDVWVDPLEAIDGPDDVTQMHQTTRISKAELIAEYADDDPDLAAIIENASGVTLSQMDVSGLHVNSTTDEFVDVIESWHIPSSPDSGDGVHAVTIDGVCLLVEEWTSRRFPIVALYWNYPDTGFWGTGLISDVAELQWEINQTMYSLQKNMWFGSMLKVFVNRNSDVQPSHITNDIAIIEHNGAPPEIYAPTAINQTQVQYLNLLIQQAYEQHGISQLMASSQKPPSIRSGVALQEFYDIQSDRFQTINKQYQHFFVALMERVIDAQKRLSLSEDEEGTRKLKWIDRNVVKRIDWKDVDLDQNDYELQLEATNFLSDTKAGKLQAVSELAQAGVIPAKWLPSLFDEPDIKKFNSLNNASFNYAEMVIEKLSDEEEEFPNPETIMDRPLVFELVSAAYQEAVCDQAPEEVLSRFTRYLGLLEAELKKEQQQMQQQQAAQAQMAPAGPEGPVEE